MAEAKADLRPGEGDAPNQGLQVLELGLLGTQKLAPGRGVVEEVADLDGGPLGMCGGDGLATLPRHAPGTLGTAAARDDLQSRDGGDARQGLATEAQGGNGLQVGEAGDLAGGVSVQGQGQVLGGDALAVIAHPQELDAALFQVDLDAVGPGVDAVLDQLLGDGGGALHHLAGGDLVDQVGRQGLDAM